MEDRKRPRIAKTKETEQRFLFLRTCGGLVWLNVLWRTAEWTSKIEKQKDGYANSRELDPENAEHSAADVCVRCV